MSNDSFNEVLEHASEAMLAGDKGLHIGPLLLGFAFDMVLLGWLVCQSVQWHNQSSGDKWILKTSVYFVIALSLGISVYAMWWIFNLLVINFGTYSTLMAIDQFSWFTILDMVAMIVVQAIYGERAYRLQHSNIFFLFLLVPLMMVEAGSAIAVKITGTQLTGTIDFARQVFLTDTTYRLNRAFYVWLSSSLATDFLITSAILRGLMIARTGWSNTDHIIHRLIRLSVQVQLPATLATIVLLSTFASKTTCAIDVFCQLILSKVYVCGLLGMLNSRVDLRLELASSNGSSAKRSNTFELSGDVLQQQTVVFHDGSWKTIKSEPTPVDESGPRPASAQGYHVTA